MSTRLIDSGGATTLAQLVNRIITHEQARPGYCLQFTFTRHLDRRREGADAQALNRALEQAGIVSCGSVPRAELISILERLEVAIRVSWQVQAGVAQWLLILDHMPVSGIGLDAPVAWWELHATPPGEEPKSGENEGFFEKTERLLRQLIVLAGIVVVGPTVAQAVGRWLSGGSRRE